MSHIFDALQKSEGEQPGNGSSASSEAAEVLRRAEQRAALQWTAAAQLEPSEYSGSAARSKLFEGSAAQLEAEGLNTLENSAYSPTDNWGNLFDEFQPIAVSASPQNRLVCITANDSPAAEDFRLLGVRLKHMRRDRVLRKVLVTSTIPEEGKSLVAANLACTLAQGTRQRVLLLEGDMRRPTLSQTFGIETGLGLCECLEGKCTPTRSIYYLKDAGFWILPAGEMPSSEQEPLQAGRLSALMEQLAEWFQWIIIDSPPVLPLADTSVWMRLADGILLVTRQGTTQKKRLQKGLEAIETSKLIGALLNCSNKSTDSYYYYRKPSTSSSNDIAAD